MDPEVFSLIRREYSPRIVRIIVHSLKLEDPQNYLPIVLGSKEIPYTLPPEEQSRLELAQESVKKVQLHIARAIWRAFSDDAYPQRKLTRETVTVVCSVLDKTKFKWHQFNFRLLHPIYLASILDQTDHDLNDHDDQTSDEKTLRHMLIRCSASLIAMSCHRIHSYREESVDKFTEIIGEIEASINERAIQIAQIIKISDESSTGGFYSDFFWRQIVVRDHDFLEFVGLQLPQSLHTYPLLSSYARLRAKYSEDSKDPDDTEDVVKVIATHNQRVFLVKGHAGFGKTTLLKWIAVKSALKQHDPELAHWNDRVPVFIQLRKGIDVGNWDLPDPQSVIREELKTMFPPRGKSMHQETSPENIRTELNDNNQMRAESDTWISIQSRRALLLIDGIDEIPETLGRDRVAVWLAGLLQNFSESIIVITSRDYALDMVEWGPLEEQGVKSIALSELNDSGVDDVVRRWHEAIATRDGERLAGVERHIDDLLAAIKKSPGLQQITRNPLLCASLCALSWNGTKRLPQDQNEFLSKSIEMLLFNRDLGRVDPITRDYPSMHSSKWKMLARRLAWRFFIGSQSEMPLNDVERILATRLTEIGEADLVKFANNILAELDAGDPVRPNGLSRYLIDRTGLLSANFGVEIPKVRFPHEMFRDYLAAGEVVYLDLLNGYLDSSAVSNNEERESLMAHLSEPRWRNVIIFAVGQSKSFTVKRSFVEQVIKVARDRSGDDCTYLYTLAEECIKAAGEDFTDLRHTIALGRVAC